MRWITPTSIFVVAVIHLFPVLGVLGPDLLAKLYQVDVIEPNELLLMRHRAVLFGLIAIVMFCGAFKPQFRVLAIWIGLLSTASFIGLAQGQDMLNPAILKVVRVDWAAIVLLGLALSTHFFARGDVNTESGV